MLTVRSPTLSHLPVSNLYILLCTLSVTLSLTHTHTCLEDAFAANSDYEAMAVTCWDGGNTLSLTKEINFPVT